MGRLCHGTPRETLCVNGASVGAVPAGSVRIGKSVYGAAVEACAVKTPEGKVQVLLFHPGKQEEHVYLRLEGQVISAVLPGESLTCIAIDPET